jgi:alginate O-acetyltransferase complex protein AlgJ
MTTPDQPLPTGGMSREAIAQAEVGVTRVTPGTARAMAALFLIAISVVPFIEWRAVWTLGRDVVAAHTTRARALPEAGGIWSQVVARNRAVLEGLNAFERGLEDGSLMGRTLRPGAQAMMSRWLAVGNERVYVGRNGWLFYRPDVEYVTGRPFLDAAQIRRRIRAAPEWTAPPAPDPRPAIVRFHQDLAARGIVLIVMPTPVKPVVHPEMLRASFAGEAGVVQNASYRTLVEDIRGAGVHVFDPAEALAASRQGGPQYLPTDTHWTPEAMESIAALVATVVADTVTLPQVPDPGYRIERSEVQNVGDTAKMLDLPDSAALVQPQAVWLRRVLEADGQLWRSSRDADVLLLGDSFANIYSLESMGWGTSAGLAEHLSLAMRRPLDRLVQNDEGAFATRAMLQREPARLQGKRVVIYQFAVRELAAGDWAVLPFER